MKVLGLFEEEEWIGTGDGKEVWVDAYHGTKPHNMKSGRSKGLVAGKGVEEGKWEVTSLGMGLV